MKITGKLKMYLNRDDSIADFPFNRLEHVGITMTQHNDRQ